MAELVYDGNGRLLFTEEMRKEYTILMPQMLPVHFGMMQKILELEGYHVDMLTSSHRGIVEEGLKYVHNDTCYPALLVIGQLIDAVKHGGYDPHKVALMITQTGGGCRASNYIHLLRKALVKAGLEFVPVISINLVGLEKNPGFDLSFGLMRKMVYAMIYGDLLVDLANQVRPYEVRPGDADAMIEGWALSLVHSFQEGRGMNRKDMRKNFDAICTDFEAIPARTGEEKIRVGIVGEIYVKFAPLGNNDLEKFLRSEDVEPVVPGLIDFILYSIHAKVNDITLYGGSMLMKLGLEALLDYIISFQDDMIAAIRRTRFRAPAPFWELHDGVKGYLSDGNKMGEGWLLTAEMLELIRSGTNNIVCTQPFGCLPNHVAGKGMLRRLKDNYPASNIVAIDYDPGATRINQENRIKLMLANARGLAKEPGIHAVKNPPSLHGKHPRAANICANI